MKLIDLITFFIVSPILILISGGIWALIAYILLEITKNTPLSIIGFLLSIILPPIVILYLVSKWEAFENYYEKRRQKREQKQAKKIEEQHKNNKQSLKNNKLNIISQVYNIPSSNEDKIIEFLSNICDDREVSVIVSFPWSSDEFQNNPQPYLEHLIPKSIIKKVMEKDNYKCSKCGKDLLKEVYDVKRFNKIYSKINKDFTSEESEYLQYIDEEYGNIKHKYNMSVVNKCIKNNTPNEYVENSKHIEFKIPLNKGGTKTVDNLKTTCLKCNKNS